MSGYRNTRNRRIIYIISGRFHDYNMNEVTGMGSINRSYRSLMQARGNANMYPSYGVKLNAGPKSLKVEKKSSPRLKILFVVLSLAITGKLVDSSFSAKVPDAQVKTGAITDDVKDGLIREIKEKGAGELSNLGVDDIGYKDDALRVYVDKRFNSLERSQQEQLVKIVANDWAKALGKDSAAVEIVEYGTDKKIDEWVVK